MFRIDGPKVLQLLARGGLLVGTRLAELPLMRLEGLCEAMRGAATAVVWCVLAPSVFACVLPAPIDEAGEGSNRAPRIVLDTVEPDPALGPVLMSTQCANAYTFRVSVIEVDKRDTVYWRRFVDYHNRTREEILESEVGMLLPNSAQPSAPRLISFQVSASDPYFNARFDEPHVIEVLVADRPFIDESRPIGRDVPPEALTDDFNWTIELTNGPCPGGT